MSTGMQKQALGEYGERVARRHLIENGMIVLDQNWRCRAGELDLVLRDGSTLVFCEVKTRHDTSRGHPLEAVTAVKAARLAGLAEAWLEASGLRPEHIRFDLVSVVQGGHGAAIVEHIAGIDPLESRGADR